MDATTHRDDRHLLKAIKNPGLARKILCIMFNVPKSVQLHLDHVPHLDKRARWRLGYILGRASYVEALSIQYSMNITDFCAGLQFNKSIKMLHLSWVNLGRGKFKRLIPFICNNPSLEDLTLSVCNLGPVELNSLADILFEGKVNLRDLSLAGNNFGDIVMEKFVLSLDKSDLSYLDLSNTGFGPRGCASVTKLLASPKCNLTFLDLSKNSINNTAASVLAKSLIRNTQLDFLGLGGNDEMTTDGWMAMLKLVCNSSSPEAIMNSNHTLSSLGFLSSELLKTFDHALGKDDANLLCTSLQQNESGNKRMTVRRKILWSQVRGDVNIGDSSIWTSAIPTILEWISVDSDADSKLVQYIEPDLPTTIVEVVLNGVVPTILEWIGVDSNNATTKKYVKYQGLPLPKANIATMRLDSIYRIVRSRPDLCRATKDKSSGKNRKLLKPKTMNLQDDLKEGTGGDLKEADIMAYLKQAADSATSNIISNFILMIAVLLFAICVPLAWGE